MKLEDRLRTRTLHAILTALHSQPPLGEDNPDYVGMTLLDPVTVLLEYRTGNGDVYQIKVRVDVGKLGAETTPQ